MQAHEGAAKEGFIPIIESVYNAFHGTLDVAPSLTRAFVPSEYWRKYGASGLPDKECSREGLKKYCQNRANDNTNCLLTVVAWGVARAPNAERIWANRRALAEAVGLVREGRSPFEAYQAFENTPGTGLGPAFFSKIIYFCGKNPNAVILDRFTAKSIDLLFDDPIPLAGANGAVAKVGGEGYRFFCESVGQIAQRLGLTPAEAEFMMYAGKSHPWRAYVKSNWVLKKRG